MTTRATLQADLQAWSNREDLATSPVFDMLLRIVEARIRRDVRSREQEVSTTLTFTGLSQELPAGFLRQRSLTLDSDVDRVLEFYPPDALRKSPVFLDASRRTFSRGLAEAYTIEGNNLLLVPQASVENPVDVTLVYVAKLAPLVSGTDTNAVVEDGYDIYLYGLLAAGQEHLEDTEEAAKYHGLYDAAVSAYNRTENRARFPHGGGLRRVDESVRVV